MNSRGLLGESGEAIAGRYLEQQGLQILARNVRSRFGELDLVAREGDETVFVEVKTRVGGSEIAPDEHVDSAKLARLERLAEHYLSRAGMQDADWRIDVIAIVLDRSGRIVSLDHLRGAYT